MKNYYTDFIKKCDAEIKRMKTEYESKMTNARNKSFAHHNFLNPIHKQYTDIQIKLKPYDRFFIEMNDEYERDSSKEHEEIFNTNIQKIPAKTRIEIMPDLILFYSIDKIISFASIEEIKLTANNEEDKPHQSEVKWVGTNETEFVQLIYALYEGKYIEGKGITKIVEEVAILLNYPLGKNWQSNHSASIHASNADYNPKIFNNLIEKYKGYQKRQINKKKEN
jgi:hypothetical protein